MKYDIEEPYVVPLREEDTNLFQKYHLNTFLILAEYTDNFSKIFYNPEYTFEFKFTLNNKEYFLEWFKQGYNLKTKNPNNLNRFDYIKEKISFDELEEWFKNNV